MAAKTSKKRKQKKTVPFALAYIQATYNNTIVTITDPQGNTLCWASGGTIGYKGTKKGTPYAAQLAAERAANKAKKEFGVQDVEIRVKGNGPGRETAIRTIANILNVKVLRDVTPLPHDGCRPPKRRRV